MSITKPQSSSRISRLPPEILGNEISRYCLSDDLDESITRKNAPVLAAPLLLCSICHDWRELALSFSVLWAHIPVKVYGEESDTLDYSDTRSTPRTRVMTPNAETVALWLNRSGHQPLRLSWTDLTWMSWEDDYYYGSDELCNRVLRLFLAHIDRWHTVSFVMPNRPFPSALYSTPKGGAPMLAAACIELDDRDQPRPSRWSRH